MSETPRDKSHFPQPQTVAWRGLGAALAGAAGVWGCGAPGKRASATPSRPHAGSQGLGTAGTPLKATISMQWDQLSTSKVPRLCHTWHKSQQARIQPTRTVATTAENWELPCPRSYSKSVNIRLISAK